MSFLHMDKAQVVEILPIIRQKLTYLYNPYHGGWCTGDAMSQAISNQIYYVEQD